ncbi:hypothetical protein HanOQP8_Chr17g0652501 [Helianthus annuus]|nr:hypothetical protein HanOQP8_Chr17g0652501 [Helianthus annuus]
MFNELPFFVEHQKPVQYLFSHPLDTSQIFFSFFVCRVRNSFNDCRVRWVYSIG